MNTRRYEYAADDAQWNSALAESATSLAERFLLENATSPLSVGNCFVALVQQNEQNMDCEDAMRTW